MNPLTAIERTPSVQKLDWARIEQDLNSKGFALTGPLLSTRECAALIAEYDNLDIYRSRVVMARHNFGRGEYQYYDYPLPGLIANLRVSLYSKLVPLATRWAKTMKQERPFPDTLKAYTEVCHEAGQTRPTPLILKYVAGDYNCLHQDLYGEHVFPLQVAILLNEPGEDFEGGEFVITEQRPRMQSRPHVVAPKQGEGVIFGVNERPVQGVRGTYRTKLRHGVSEVLSGKRHTLGIIFHDAS
ncbi:MAG: proline hydroxylase [Kordiimonadales bacterium]|nr:MAG: proline hydroxylase [Kordiimonadales bacterium]